MKLGNMVQVGYGDAQKDDEVGESMRLNVSNDLAL